MVEILVKDWLNYSVAFACGFALALGGRFLAFSIVMGSSWTFSMTAFVGFVILLPVLLGVYLFGLVYARLSGLRITGGEWLNALAFTFAVTVMCVGLILSRAMSEMAAMILLAALIFIGGRILLSRKTDA